MKNASLRITRELTKKVEKHLEMKAEELSSELKRTIRDELEQTLHEEMYDSFGPVQISGKKAKTYNETHKHQVARPYHHTGILISHTHAKIDGDKIKIVVDGQYPDGTPVEKVYKWLKNGTKKESEYDVYILGGKGSHTPYVGWEPTPPHKFEQKTLARMENYLATIADDVINHPEHYGM